MMTKMEYVMCVYFTILALICIDNLCDIMSKIYAEKVYHVPVDYVFMMEKMFNVYTASLIFMLSVFFVFVGKYIEKVDK